MSDLLPLTPVVRIRLRAFSIRAECGLLQATFWLHPEEIHGLTKINQFPHLVDGAGAILANSGLPLGKLFLPTAVCFPSRAAGAS